MCSALGEQEAWSLIHALAPPAQLHLVESFARHGENARQDIAAQAQSLASERDAALQEVADLNDPGRTLEDTLHHMTARMALLEVSKYIPKFAWYPTSGSRHTEPKPSAILLVPPLEPTKLGMSPHSPGYLRILVHLQSHPEHTDELRDEMSTWDSVIALQLPLTSEKALAAFPPSL
ncbi:hypothetical protein DYB28_012131, partial [Aphanomyces astaci]